MCCRRGIAAALMLLGACIVRADDERSRFFEAEVRPLLIDKCSGCHGAKKQEGGLRVDGHATLLKGGDTGAAVVPGDPVASLMIQAVRREGDVQMPPDDPLTERQVATLTEWVRQGAVWPEETSSPTLSRGDAARDHWAFQPLRDPDVPAVEGSAQGRTPVDAFILARLDESGLPISPEADRRTLIRRATYTLTGLPPSPEEVARFVNDPDPLAYEYLIDRLLGSPHYGEHWARHWLDVARYADTKGYVYAREERFWIQAWAYRDWVVRALNADMPYSRFLLLQIAADQVLDREEFDLAAMGFLTLGRRFLGVERDIIDDRIDTVCRATMGLTVGCARCHDHKYDPIPTADYYSLYGVFDSCAERAVALGSPPENAEYLTELNARQEKLQSTLAQRRSESSTRTRDRIGDYLHAQTELDKYPAQGFDQIFQESDILPEFVRRWEKYLRDAKRRGDPVWVPWHAYAELSPDDFAALAPGVTQQLASSAPDAVNPFIALQFATPPASFAVVIERYAALFKSIDAQWKTLVEEAGEMNPPTALDDPAAEQLRHVLYGPHAPCEVPDEPIVHTEAYFPTSVCEELWKLQGEVDRWVINSPVEPAYALALVDRERPSEPRIMQRGNPLKQGVDVPRQFLSVIAGENRQPFEHGSGRLELAKAIIDRTNPLTARVMVNRVWMHHFGEGLVPTPSDFGTRAAEPSHPELLDWLAARFIESGWSLKTLHRLMLNSAAFRQSSHGPDDRALRAAATRQDPANRLLWRMNEHRLTFEEFRDTLLAASGRLDVRVGGKPADMFTAPYPMRRTLYGRVDRQFFPSILRMFDFANPDLHTPERPETTVPQQALFLMNHPLVLEQARALAAEAEPAPSPEERVRRMFQRTLQREPTAEETTEAVFLVSASLRIEQPSLPATAADWQYGYGALNEETKRVDGFTPLPHFTGTAWQGGPKYPDKKLGWAQLTATGGHPGNDKAHACIRRWTAPRAMTVEIRSTLTHQPAAGDGIRALIISSRSGPMATENVHMRSVEINVDSLAVETGEALDFLVDIGDGLNSDQFLWTATIIENSDNAPASVWNSESDFTREIIPQLTGWEQLAQVLLCSNEFLFID
ncbi:MAG: PSD1 and planctomycete cytochrome C domain-containing protein [Planctomycetaceae bacterium]